MIATALSLRVSDLTMITEIAKPTAAASATSWPGSRWPVSGRTIVATPIRPRTMATIRAAVQPLAQERDREQRGPDRHRELDRHDLGDRDHGQRQEPAELGGVVEGVARDMQAGAAGAQGREAAAGANQRIEEHEAEQRAHLHDLEDVQASGRLAAGDDHHHHGGQPAGHPGRGFLGRVLEGHDGRGDSRPVREVDRARARRLRCARWGRCAGAQRLAPLAGPATLAAGDGATGTPAGELIDACRS